MAKVSMIALNNRPTSIISHLDAHAVDTLYVQCRLSSGEDGFVSLREIVTAIEDDLVRRTRLAKGSQEV